MRTGLFHPLSLNSHLAQQGPVRTALEVGWDGTNSSRSLMSLWCRHSCTAYTPLNIPSLKMASQEASGRILSVLVTMRINLIQLLSQSKILGHINSNLRSCRDSDKQRTRGFCVLSPHCHHLLLHLWLSMYMCI